MARTKMTAQRRGCIDASFSIHLCYQQFDGMFMLFMLPYFGPHIYIYICLYNYIHIDSFNCT